MAKTKTATAGGQVLPEVLEAFELVMGKTALSPSKGVNLLLLDLLRDYAKNKKLPPLFHINRAQMAAMEKEALEQICPMIKNLLAPELTQGYNEPSPYKGHEGGPLFDGTQSPRRKAKAILSVHRKRKPSTGDGEDQKEA
jgi:hypothetical protein